jgi:hypothetical protein
MPVPRRPSSAPRSPRETVTGHLVAREPAAPVPVLLRPGSPTAVVHAVEAVARSRARAELPQDSTSIPVRDDARREGLEAPTARSVAWCSASIWWGPDGSGLLRWDGSSVASGLDGSSRIVWMIIGMIKCLPTQNRMARQAGPNHPIASEGRRPLRVPRCAEAAWDLCATISQRCGGSSRGAPRCRYTQPGLASWGCQRKFVLRCDEQVEVPAEYANSGTL